tara:strand:+ start:260 stop:559 length:300 start_codon:yes stop_codon:yes gene_type:complete
MTTQHTPAPWSVEIDHATGNAEYVRAYQDGEMLDVASVLCDQTDRANANARLIAAAPDLLAVLCEMLGAAETDLLDDKSNVWRSAMNDARAAIAKAKGS